MGLKMEKDLKTCKRAILFELDSVPINGHEIVYKAVEKEMKSRDIDFSPKMFMRYCLNLSVKKYVPIVLEAMDKKRISEEKLTADIEESVKKAFLEGKFEINSGFGKLLERAASEHIEIGAVSALDPATSIRLAEKLKIPLNDKNMTSCSQRGSGAPSAEAWIRLAKTMNVESSKCMAVVASGLWCKSAHSSGVHCIVVMPDKFTSFQDFSGADYVVEKELDSAMIQNILTTFVSR